MAQDGFTVLLAGGETTSQVLTHATFHLLTNKNDALAKLKNELSNVMLDPNMRVELKTLEQLPWLVCLPWRWWRNADTIALQTAVIKESLRISALVTSRLPLISPKEPLRYQEWEIPAGVSTVDGNLMMRRLDLRTLPGLGQEVADSHGRNSDTREHDSPRQPSRSHRF